MNCNGKENKMADEKRIENTAKQMEIVLLRKMGIDVVLDKDEFNRALKANEKVQKMEMDLSELSKLNSELKELKIEKQAVEENKQKLKNASIAQGKQNFAEFIEAVKALKDFIPASKEFSPELRLSTRHKPYWYDINRVKIPVDNSLDKTKDIDFYDITEGKVLFVAKRMDDSIVCITKSNTNDAQIYYDENTGFVDEKNKPWYLYEKFADSNHIIELKTAIKESLEKRIGKTKEQLDKAHKELHEAEKSVQKKNLLINEPDDESKVLEKFKNGINISPDEFLELSRSLDSKNFELLANKIQAGTAEYWTNMACIQIEEYNTNQLKWILENREVRFDEVSRNDALNEKVKEEANTSMNLPQWAAVSDDPEIIDAVFSKMTEKDFKWAKENGVFKIAEDFYKDKNENFSFPFETLKDWVKKYDPDYSNDKIVRHFYARQVPPEDQSYPIDKDEFDYIANSDEWSSVEDRLNNVIDRRFEEEIEQKENDILSDVKEYIAKETNGNLILKDSELREVLFSEELVQIYAPKEDFLANQPEEVKAALIKAGIARSELYNNVESIPVSEEARNAMVSASYAGQGGITQKAFADNGIEIDLATANALENCFSQIEAITKYTADGHDLFHKGNGIDTISEHTIEYSETNKAWFVHEKNWLALSAIKGNEAEPDDYMEKASRVGDRNWALSCEELIKYVYQEIKEDGEMEKEFPDTFKKLEKLNEYLEAERIKENGVQRRKEDYFASIKVSKENFRDVFNEAIKLPKFKDKPLEAARWCFSKVPKENKSKVVQWFSNLGCKTKKDTDKLFNKWNRENNPKPNVNKSKKNDKDDWSISY